MVNPRKIVLLLAVLVCLVSRGFAGTALGSITVSGAEQSSGSTWDTGNVTVTINGVSVSFAYGQYSTAAGVAAALGALISNNCSMAVTAQAAGTTLTFYQKGSNTINSMNLSSVSNFPALFPSNSFLIDRAGSWSVPRISSVSPSSGSAGSAVTIGGT